MRMEPNRLSTSEPITPAKGWFGSRFGSEALKTTCGRRASPPTDQLGSCSGTTAPLQAMPTACSGAPTWCRLNRRESCLSITENEEPESITKGKGPAPSIHALTSTAAPVSMRTILTARTDGRPTAGWESAHPEGSICRDDPTAVDPVVPWPVVAAKETSPRVVEARTRMANAIKNERNTPSVCLVNVPSVLAQQDCYRLPPELGHLARPGERNLQLGGGLSSQAFRDPQAHTTRLPTEHTTPTRRSICRRSASLPPDRPL